MCIFYILYNITNREPA